MRRLALIVVFVSMTAGATAQNPMPGPATVPPVTLYASDILLSRVLRDLSHKAGLEIVLAPNVADERLSELLYLNAAFEDVFVNIVHGQCLAYRSPDRGRLSSHDRIQEANQTLLAHASSLGPTVPTAMCRLHGRS